jgi:hypothetical protein
MFGRASVAWMALGLFVVAGRPSCPRKTPAPPDASASATASVVVALAPPPPPAPTPIVDAGPSPATLQAIERSQQWLDDLRWSVEHKSTVNPKKAGEGDADSKCDAVAAAREGLTDDADPTYQKNLDDAAALCAFDIPLVRAHEALDRLGYTPSQASRLLQCNVSRRELDKARAVKPHDRLLLQLDARRANVCH